MPSLLPGFEYDIFISYRHNDNLDGWVSDFVQNLEKELRGTLKDTVTIYFDKNPHDGLLETHSVDKSLEGKLKCLIFIPIISQTYCDPKSFAWQHEFCAFNRLARQDSFGRDIRLGNGNVSSRILPIKIHDLDAEDKAIIENEIGAVLRAIEFIFKSAGVNRPLRPHEDRPQDNLNKTFYRDQINKVANAIKGILNALKTNDTKNAYSLAPTPKKPDIKIKLLSLAALAMIILLSYFVYSIFNPAEESVGKPEKSVAVLAFADLSKDGDLEYLGDGVAEEIINVLAQSSDLKVIARSSSFQFKGKNEDLREIGRKLGVAAILEGSVRKYDDQVRVTAQLIKVSDGSHYWSRSMDQKTENVFEIQDAIAKEVAGILKATLLQSASSKEDKPWNEEARKLYQKGRFFYDRSGDGDMEMAVEFLQKSVSIDSSHAISLAFLAAAYGNIGDFNKRDQYFLKAKTVDPTSPQVQAVQGARLYLNLDFTSSYNELYKALLKGKSDPLVLRTACYFSWLSGNSKQAVKFAVRAIEVDPLIGRSYVALLQAQWYDHDYIELLKSSQRAVELFPDSQDFRRWYAIALAVNNQPDSALKEITLIASPQEKVHALKVLYFKQSNFKKLDSLYAVTPRDQLTIVTEAEQLAINNKKEEAVNLLVGTKVDVSILQALRGNLILGTLSGDRRLVELLKKYKVDDELPLN